MRVDTLEGPCQGPAGKKPSESAKKKPKKKNLTIKMKRGAGEVQEAEEAEDAEEEEAEEEEEEEGATACV